MSARRRGPASLALGSIVFATRLPFLFEGYGGDPDAWRVLWTGHEIARTGTYMSSRAPGNPIPELAAAALHGAPAWLMTGTTAVLSAVCAVLFGQLLQRFGCRSWFLGALAFALTPVVWIHSTDAMDYLWALAFVLGAWRLAIDRRWGPAGILVGIATGCRLTSLGMLAPLTILALESPDGRVRYGHLVRLWAAGLFAGLVAFSPVVLTYGLTFLHAYEQGYPPWLYVVKNLSVDVWGVIGFAALAIAGVWAAWFRIPAERSELPGAAGRLLVAAAGVIGVELVMFFRLPHEAAYLIPAVPFTILLFARGLTRKAFVALCVGVIVSAGVLKVSEPGKRPALSGTTALHWGSRVLELDLLRGPVLTDFLRRREDLAYARRVRDRVRQLDGPAVIAAQEWLPYLRVLAGESRDGAVDYVYTLDRPTLDSLRLAHIPVYDLPGAESYTQTWRGYSLRAAGSRALDVEPR